MTDLTPKAKIILNWLKNPITRRYIKLLLEDEKNLSIIATEAMSQAVSNGLMQRSEDEIKAFSSLKATKILLSNIPYKTSLKEDKITEEDVKELENFFEQLPN